MTYAEEFRAQIAARNFPKILELWQEYCAGDVVDAEEIIEILTVIKRSDFAKPFGQHVEAILPLVFQITDEAQNFVVLSLVFDLETTNSETLATLALEELKRRFSQDPLFNDKIRLVGLRTRDNFQGALSNFLLLNHAKKGKCVLHAASWGVGEIIDCSFLREQITVEFENLHGGKKDISFKNAFKTIVPLDDNHFLVQRFINPDDVEKRARETPVECIKQILADLGPQTAIEFKELLEGHVIAEAEYAKWWQQSRAKLKKDPCIEVPETSRLPFRLLKGQASDDDRVSKAFAGKNQFSEVLAASYALLRDFPQFLKDEPQANKILERLDAFEINPTSSDSEKLAVLLLRDNFELKAPGGAPLEESLKAAIEKLGRAEKALCEIEIIALRKRLLIAIQKYRQDWVELFFSSLFVVEPVQLKEWIFKELFSADVSDRLKQHISDLATHPKKHPEALLWYFQKVLDGSAPYFHDKEGKVVFFEAILTLLSHLDQMVAAKGGGIETNAKELSKKIHTIFTASRFIVVRTFLKETDLHHAQEFLLLASKCRIFSDHDLTILRSLAEVAHPALARAKKPTRDAHTIWTTQEGYAKAEDRIKTIGSKEIVESARDIENARAHGDLRENFEFKSALEKRKNLMWELKTLSENFRRARIIEKDEVSTDAVDVGVTVELITKSGERKVYSILGPWDTDIWKVGAGHTVISFQSQIAQSMMGLRVGDRFSFKEDELEVANIRSFFEVDT